MKKIITMSLIALGSLSMLAGENPTPTKSEQINNMKCYYFEFYKQEFKNGVPLYANYLIEEEYSLHLSEDSAEQRFSEMWTNYNTNIDSNFTGVVYMGAYRVALISQCRVKIEL